MQFSKWLFKVAIYTFEWTNCKRAVLSEGTEHINERKQQNKYVTTLRSNNSDIYCKDIYTMICETVLT